MSIFAYWPSQLAGGQGGTRQLIHSTIKNKMRHFLPLLLLIGVTLSRAADAPLPANIIFDTDMGGDCDDVGALFVLHGAVERGEARLLATMGCVSSEAIAPCLDAINTWFARPEIPVGTLKDDGLLADPAFPAELVKHYPHRWRARADYPDAVALYRRILATQPDGSVVIVAVGPLRNLANLLQSGPDVTGALDGAALVAKKVKLLHVMGGHYPPDTNKKEPEYNFQKDPASAALICAKWPTPVLFNGEGGSTNSGRRVTYEMPEHNPLTMAYAAYPGTGFAGDRLSWDPVSCLVAVRGAAPWYDVVETGRNEVDAATGVNRLQPGGAPGHSYLVLKKWGESALESALEDLMTAGRGRPLDLTFNTVYYARAGMAQISASGAAEASTAAMKAFDHDIKTAWLDKSAEAWIQCQYVDGRKSRVTSYSVVFQDRARLPHRLELSGSNDNGRTWTQLDVRVAPAFPEHAMRQEFPTANPAKYNIYRLHITAAEKSEGVPIATLELNESIQCRPGKDVTGITLEHSALRLAAHGRATLNATLAPVDAYERGVVWTSTDPAVAEVRHIGEQTAIISAKNPGTCTITAAVGEVRQICQVEVTDSTLPAEWSFAELGIPPIPGCAMVTEGRFSLTGCGHAMTGFWERVRDQGSYLSQAVSGDVTLSACLMSLAPDVGGPSYPWDSRPSTAAGVMLRESSTEGCGRYALLEVQATGKLVFRWRDKPGPDESHVKEFGKVTLPLYLKLTRKGQQIEGFSSPDGRNWSAPLMTHPTSFSAENRLGFSVSSGNTFASSTAVFESVILKRN